MVRDLSRHLSYDEQRIDEGFISKSGLRPYAVNLSEEEIAAYAAYPDSEQELGPETSPQDHKL